MPADKDVTELEVILRTYQLTVWSCKHVARFPHCHRFPFGDRLESRLFEIQDLLLQAKYTRDRVPLLRRVNLQLEQLRFQFRLAADLHCISLQSAGHAAEQVNEIGRMVGGWLNASAGSGRGP